MVQHLKPAGSAHLEIRQHQVNPAVIDIFDARFGGIGQYQAIALRSQDEIQNPAHPFLVLNDQDC